MRILNKKKIKTIIFCIIFLIINGCSTILMNPSGEISIQQKKLILITISLISIVIIPVIFMTIFFSYKYRKKNNNKKKIKHPNKIEFFCWIIPIIIISILSIITWKTTHDLDPYKKLKEKKDLISIQVISANWKWIFIYPKENIATVNEIAIPINTPIEFKITSDSVMNSFFIPSLGSQIYAMPGMQTKLNLIANKIGIYKGFSSNYSGHGFSNMKFQVLVKKNKKEFKNWIEKVKKSKKKLEYIKQEKNKKNIEYFSSVKKKLFEKNIEKFFYLNK